MNKKQDLLRFFLVVFALEIFLTLLWMPALLFSPGLWLFFLLYFMFIIGIVTASYHLFIKMDRLFHKILILALAHTLFLAPLVFTSIAAIGGVSQAVVEGVAGGVLHRYTQYALHLMYVLAFGQIFIIPWSLFCNYLLKKTVNTKIVKVIFLSLIGFVLVYLLLIYGSRILFMRGFKPNAKSMYQHYFSTPIGKIHRLRSGGLAWLDNPVCIKFQSKEKIVLKDQNLYSPTDISEPRRFFLMEYPNDKHILNDTANLACISYVKKEETYTQTYWLLYNKKTGHYYFLIQ